MKVFYMTTVHPSQPLLSGPKSGSLILVSLYILFINTKRKDQTSQSLNKIKLNVSILFYALYYFSLEGFGNGFHKTLLFFSDIYWTPGFDWKGPMNKGLSIYLFVLLSGSFLGIGSLVFRGTQYVVRGPYDVVHDSQIFWKKYFWPRNWKFIGKFSHCFFLNLVYNKTLYYLLYSCINPLFSKNLVPEIWAKML